MHDVKKNVIMDSIEFACLHIRHLASLKNTSGWFQHYECNIWSHIGFFITLYTDLNKI